jgi:4-amino-4-deoxy-L-arabinose transferase-like glycosyltransferase
MPGGVRSRVDATVATVMGIAALGFLLRLAIWFRSIAVIDRLFIPDDTYYTLTIARSLARGHGPTTDGHTLTSGFQALLGFLMVPVYWVTDNPDTALRVDLALLIVVDTLTIIVLAWVAYRFAGRIAAVTAAALWAVSPVAISMALGGLETSLAIFFAVTLVAVWIWMNDAASTRRAVLVGVVAALALLARVDVALLVALLVALQLWRGPRRLLLPSAIAGAVVVAPWWIWCTVQFGTPVPTSGEAAHRMAAVSPFSQQAFAQVAGAVSGGPFAVFQWLRDRVTAHTMVGTVLFWVFFLALLGIGVLWARRPAMPQLAVAALPLFAAGLMLFYAWFGVAWYFTRYLAPVACVVSLIIAVAVEHAWHARGAWRTPMVIASAAVLIVGLIAVVRVSRRHYTETRAVQPTLYDTATGYRDAALVVVNVPAPGSVLAAWQSGAFGYYADDRIEVVNLDGVVNPDAEEAQQHDRTIAYMRERKVDWVVDWTLHIIWFVVKSKEQVHPPPTLQGVRGLPQFPPFPEYAMASIQWPPRSRALPGGG